MVAVWPGLITCGENVVALFTAASQRSPVDELTVESNARVVVCIDMEAVPGVALILRLLLRDDFPQIWVPSWENRDLRQLLWHRHRMVQARTRIMNQLQAVALNEGLRSKRRLWRESGREQLEAFRLAPWASRRREDLLKLLDGLNPTIAELTQAIQQEVEKCPAAQRLRTHPGVGPLTALAFVLIIGKADRFQCGKQIASYLGLVPLEDSTSSIPETRATPLFPAATAPALRLLASSAHDHLPPSLQSTLAA